MRHYTGDGCEPGTGCYEEHADQAARLLGILERSAGSVEDQLEEARDLLAEKVEYGPWTHAHCDGSGGDDHRFDTEWWREDVEAFLRRTDPPRRSGARRHRFNTRGLDNVRAGAHDADVNRHTNRRPR